MKLQTSLIAPNKKVRLSDYDPGYHGDFPDKEAATDLLKKDIKRMVKLQDVFFASGKRSLLIIFQALDGAGKDGAIKHVMSGLNPQGCQVASFKAPSARELEHDYLWRCNNFLPDQGRIGVFNRSYYEEVLAVRVHPELLEAQNLPPVKKGGSIWRRRFHEINNYEKYLTDNGTRVLKFFLHLSKDEQKDRFMARIENPSKNWKLSDRDVKEREYWDQYQKAYSEMLSHTSTKHAPWHIIPADKKWFSRVAIAAVVVRTLEAMKLKYPKLNDEQRAGLEESRRILESES